MNPLDSAAELADAVLLEGYLLYPYRASAQKNALRWQFGVLVPQTYGEETAEPWRSRTECLLEPRAGSTLRLRLRFLQLQERALLDADGTAVDELDVDGELYLRWDEGLPREVDAEVPLADLGADPVTVPVVTAPTQAREAIVDAGGTTRGHYQRRTGALRGRVVLSVAEVPGPYGALRLRVDVVNDAPMRAGADRGEALGSSLISAHTLLAVDDGAFLSSVDPPEWAAPAVAACVNEQSWPVLAGPEGCDTLVLASPIILPDHPQLAPESPTNLFDGTENDEILTLRTMALTEAEKREARATDPRAATIVDTVDAMGPEMFERLHGAIRDGGRAAEVPTLVTPGTPWWDPAADASVDPGTDSVLVDGREVARGSSVVLMPGHGGDAQDEFLRGLRATVQAVVHDVDGQTHVAVTIDDDPGADLQSVHGRFRYFRPDELTVTP